MKRVTGRLFLVSILIILSIEAAEAKKLKLFINDITAEQGVSRDMAAKARDYLSLSIFENFNREYQVITDEDIKIMFKKAADIQSTGCDGETCVVQIADAINAEEIIWGTMRREEGKIRVTLNNLKRDSTTLELMKKSIVNEFFHESQMEWYMKEVAKKLVNPSYRIDHEKAPGITMGKFNVGAIDIKRVEGVDISIMKFDARDESLLKNIDYLKAMVEAGDTLFKKNNYPDSREMYRDVIARIKEKVSPANQQKMEPFIKSVYARIASTHINEFKKNIENTDSWLKSKDALEKEYIPQGLEKYGTIFNEYNKLPAPEKQGLEEVNESIQKRLSILYLAWASVKEKEGDSFYSDYKFKPAIEKYEAGIKIITGSGLSRKELNERKDKLTEKMNVVLLTGASWLENKVRSLCVQAEYYNVRDNKSRAVSTLESALDLMAFNRIFLNDSIKSLYEEYSRVIGHKSDVGDRTKFFHSDNRYGTLSLSFFGLSLASFGGGYYYNTQYMSIKSDYNDLATKYSVSADFNQATAIHRNMNSKKDQADRTLLYRNISMGGGLIFLGVSGFFTYRYFAYKSLVEKLRTTYLDDIFIMPIVTYSYRRGSWNPNERDYFTGAAVTFRF